MNAASPIVKLGKMMWKVIVNANWMRASSTASRSMAPASLLFISDGARIVARFDDRVETGACGSPSRVTSCAYKNCRVRVRLA